MDIKTTKQSTTFKGHESAAVNVKYGSNELINTILSGSNDNSVRLWDIRSVSDIKVDGNSNVICSGSIDNTISFWDIRNKNELFIIKGDDIKDDGIFVLNFERHKNFQFSPFDLFILNLECVNSFYQTFK
ncbi:WD-40 repeat protein [Reticulomyxa filosa]|uniref:WD-40 repeat protein n=1 Tax=Reticulomyxa filosa TaxID=46433 RepID=X6PDV9_RETFI|nr:WD-40 repeat protein [Reticulomyxa filosa]|eukprot:ETO35857.1 WD-40 repeat protein [Reticulomyxa filosa]